MKKILIVLCLLSVSTAFADFLIVQDMEQTGPTNKKMEMPMKFKGDKIRMDMGTQASTIIDLQSGDMTMLIHPQKTYMLIPSQTLKQIKVGDPNALKDAGAPKPTGKKQNINGFDAQEYVLNTRDAKITLWLAKNVPNQELLMQQFKKLQETAKQGGVPGLDYSTLPGFPIRVEMASPAMGKNVVTIQSIQEVSLPDTDFQPPADYKKAEMPTIK